MKNTLFIITAIILLHVGAVEPIQAEMRVMPDYQMETTTGNEGICVPAVEDGCLKGTRKDETSPLDDLTVIEELEEDTKTLPETTAPQTAETNTADRLNPKPAPPKPLYDPETTQAVINAVTQALEDRY